MKKLINGIIKHRKGVLIVFVLLTIISGILMTQVNVNYDLQDFLPTDVPSTEALKELEDNYDFTIPNARVVFKVGSLEEALIFKEELSEIDEVKQVLWLDDSIDLSIPLEIHDQKLVESFYSDGHALFQVTAETENSSKVLDSIYQIQEQAMVTGQLVDLSNAQNSTQSEIVQISLYAAPVVLIILLLTTHSWLEPLIFFLTISVGILLNMGSNIFLGEISFITQAIAAILQLAVSMDYAIFLLNRFNQNRKLGYEPEEAMAMAIRRAFTAVFSSSITTTFGFLALVFMRFRIGADLGIVMAKGILLSFVSVMVFMPCLLLALYKLVDKTTHRSFLPDFSFLGRFVRKAKWGLIILAILVAIPSFLASRSNSFIYGMGGYPDGSKMMTDKEFVDDNYGEQEQMSLLVPKGSISKELDVLEKLEAESNILSVISYVNTVDKAIPVEVIDEEEISMLISDKYSQFIITASVASEGDESFALVERVKEIATESYEDNYQLVGQNVIMLDMKDTIEADDIIVNGLAVLAIALIILIAFRSFTIPILLVLTIEIAIWINLAIPYFSGTSLSYIGYLIVSTVQLGATVDYAILYTEHYLENRKYLHKSNALVESIRETIPSLLPPALILMFVGLILSLVSSLAIVSELGFVLGRGAFLSLIMVVFVLPGILCLFDKVIEKTSYKLYFLKKNQAEILNKNEEVSTNMDFEPIKMEENNV